MINMVGVLLSQQMVEGQQQDHIGMMEMVMMQAMLGSTKRMVSVIGDPSAWKQIGQDIDGEAACDYSGGSVALSVDRRRLAIRVTGNDGYGSNAGHVWIYEENDASDPNEWKQIGQDTYGEAAGGLSGYSVVTSAGGRWNEGSNRSLSE